MKITLLLADFARVANGKLDVIGGGWSMMNAQGPFGFFVAALFQIPWDRTNQKHKFRLELLDADSVRKVVDLPYDAVLHLAAISSGTEATRDPGWEMLQVGRRHVVREEGRSRGVPSSGVVYPPTLESALARR